MADITQIFSGSSSSCILLCLSKRCPVQHTGHLFYVAILPGEWKIQICTHVLLLFFLLRLM